MKTKTTNATKSTNAIGKRNFFQKTFVLLAILAFTSLGYKAKAQTYEVDINTTNPSCVFRFDLKDVFNNTIIAIDADGNPGVFKTSGCISGLDHINITGGNCLGTITYGSGGVFGSTTFSLCGGTCATIGLSSTVSTTNLPSCSGTTGLLITLFVD